VEAADMAIRFYSNGGPRRGSNPTGAAGAIAEKSCTFLGNPFRDISAPEGQPLVKTVTYVVCVGGIRLALRSCRRMISGQGSKWNTLVV
jgi:hypothetical protein